MQEWQHEPFIEHAQVAGGPDLTPKSSEPADKVIALAGNPDQSESPEPCYMLGCGDEDPEC